MSDYKGDNPSKKWARFSFWHDVLAQIHKDRFYGGKHLVLASWEAGDISVLRGLGVSVKNIVAVERDPQAAYLAKEKYPEANIICGDVAKIVKEYRRQFTTAYLDFCNTASTSIINTTLQVAMHGLKEDAFLGVTLQAGREKGQTFRNIENCKQNLEKTDREAMALDDLHLLMRIRKRMGDRDGRNTGTNALRKDIDEALDSGDGFAIAELAAELRDSLKRPEGRLSAADARLSYLYDHLRQRLLPFRQAVYPTDYYEYVSSSKDSKGVPMAIGLFHAVRMAKTMPEVTFKRKSNRLALEKGGTRVHQCSRTEAELRDDVLDLIDYIERHNTKNQDIRTVLDDVPLLFNLPKETVTAWRAHKTRGTYENEHR